MGKLRFSKAVKFFALALLGMAATIVAVAVLSTPAAAKGGGGGDSDDYPWDTDNLRYGSYNAKSFNIPFHKYGGYSGVAACQSGVADGFFQTDNSVVNDFPVLVSSGSGDSITWSIAAGSAGNNAGCDTFVAQQDKLAAQVASGLTYGLSEDGKVYPVSGIEFTTGRSVSDLNYVAWTAKASSDYTLVGSHGATRDSRYLRRVDGHLNRLAISPQSAGNTITVPSGDSISPPTGDFGASWHSSRSNQLVGGVYYYRYKAALYPSLARHLTKTKSDELCRYRFHPRGEDSHERIGGSTGRSLSGLSHADAQIADRFWCRSDVRYERRFAVEVHDLPDGIIAYAGAPASGTFTAYGRLGCYYTSQGASLRSGSTLSQCGYRFPLPKCDPNPDNGTDSDWRNYTNREIQSSRLHGKVFTKADGDYCAPQCTHNGTKRDMTDAEISEYIKDNPLFAPNTDGTTPCVKSAGPPQQAGFTADACVTASLEIYENRIVGSAAEPGVPASDRTLAVAAGRTAWDLDITSPHHNTASPPRDTTSTPADATGCADGSESRADHSSDAGSAVRKNTAAGVDLALPASSAAAQSTHPPHSKGFASAGTDYTGAVKNIAHRYASNVAENTCAAAREFAELVLEILKGRRLVFQSYIDGYEDTIDTAITGYSSYSTTIQSGSENSANAYNNLSLEEMRQNALERQREKYVKDRQAYLAALKAALANAETAYQRATNSTKLVLGSVNSNGCINSYDNAITALKDLAAAAETAFPSTTVNRSVALTKKEYRVTGTQTATTLTHGTKDFMRLYNALSLKSYTDKVPKHTVTSSPASDARPADNNLTWTLGDWSDASRTYSCAHLWASRYYQETYGGAIQCVKRRQATSPVSKSCPAGYSIKPVLLGERCSRQNKDGEEESTSVTYSCNTGWTRRINPNNLFQYICTRSVVDSTRTARYRDLYKRTDNYSNVVSGTVTGTLSGTTGKKADFRRVYTGSRLCEYATGTITSGPLRRFASRTVPTCRAIAHNAATGTTVATATATVIGTAHSVTLPSEAQMATARPSALAAVTESSLLGKLHPSHSSRANLKAATTAARNTAAANLGTLTQTAGTTVVPSGFAAAINYTAGGPSAYAARFAPPASTAQRTAIATAATNYINEYAKAYQTAYNQAAGDMGTTATTTTWNNFDWRYQTSTLAWSNYQEDPATTYSGWAPRAGEAETDRDGTGCDLIAVAADGTVSVEATRLDYETSSYGKGSVYGVRTDAQRTCKIRRTRTPELLLEYQPSRPSGTDASKTASYFYVDYQPTVPAGQPAAERFKLYDEAEVFAVKVSLADSSPVLCYQPGEALVAHVAAKGIDTVNKAVFRNASGFAGGSKKHCYRHPSTAQLVSNGKSQPAFAFFDDTAHSAMASVNVVWQQPNPKIVSKLGSADDLKMMANTVSLVASSPVAYADATRTSSFYGTYYTFPTDTSVNSPSGWDITGHPTLTLTSTFEQHQVQAKDTAAKTPTSHAIFLI